MKKQTRGKKRANIRKHPNQPPAKRRRTGPMSSSTYGTTLTMPRSFPDTVVTRLVYQDTIFNRNNVGGVVCSWRYRINSAYDPDPLLGTGAISGFAEWAAIFTHYRILDMAYDAQIANNEAFPLMVVAAPTLLDLGANSSNLDQIPELPYGRKQILSAKGGYDKCRIRGRVSIPKLEGSREPITDQSFASQTTTNPAMIRFMNFGFTGGSLPLVNGVFISLKLTYTVSFFARTAIFS
jgi:hypothetical protein